MFRLPQNGGSRCTESSNFSGEKISFSSSAAKTIDVLSRELRTDHADLKQLPVLS